MNVQAQKVAALARQRRIVAKVKRRAAQAFAAFAIFAAVVAYDQPPEPFVPVVAWTGDNWHKAYMDENGEFRSFEDGTPIGQVTKWTSPRGPLW